jgi:hypothetical protein
MAYVDLVDRTDLGDSLFRCDFLGSLCGWAYAEGCRNRRPNAIARRVVVDPCVYRRCGDYSTSTILRYGLRSQVLKLTRSCISKWPLMAHFGCAVMTDLGPECPPKRTPVDHCRSHMKGHARRARFGVAEAVYSHSEKYSRFVFPQITSISATVSSHTRGVSRSSRTRDEMRWTRAASGVRAKRRADCSP